MMEFELVAITASTANDALCATREVLIVDDNAAVLRSMELVLNRKNWTIHTAPDAECALLAFADLAANGKSIDLVLTDLHMPGKSGMDLCKAVRDLSDDTRLIIATGAPQDLCDEQLQQLGVAAVIPKPWGGDELITTVTKVLEGSRSARIDTPNLCFG